VKLSLCLIKHPVIKKYGRAEIYLHTCLSSGVDEWSVSSSGLFTPGKTLPTPIGQNVWWIPAGLDVVEKISCPFMGIELRFLRRQNRSLVIISTELSTYKIVSVSWIQQSNSSVEQVTGARLAVTIHYNLARRMGTVCFVNQCKLYSDTNLVIRMDPRL
jgi:hypothetical protein